MTQAAVRPGKEPLVGRHLVDRQLQELLDELPLNDRIYHHLHFSMPMTAELILRVQELSTDGRVLIVGGNTLLCHALLRLGYAVDIWRLAGGHLTDDLAPFVKRLASVAQLGSGDLDFGDCRYDVIIVPFVVEGLSTRPEEFLKRLKQGLASNGNILLATVNVARLETRFQAAAGRNFLPGVDVRPLTSFSWPALRIVRYYHRDEMLLESQRAGLWVRECSYVTGTRPYRDVDPLGLGAWVVRRGSHWARQLVPSMRDALLLHLSPRPGAEEPEVTGASNEQELKTVSVVVSVRSGAQSLAEALEGLQQQTYPRDSYEVLVIHDGTSADVGEVVRAAASQETCPVRQVVVSHLEGPEAMNQATAAAKGEICAYTDDLCRFPTDWILAGVDHLDRNTAVVSGPIYTMEGSEEAFLEPPTTRPDFGDGSAHFPIVNVFYRRAAVLDVGGFDESFSRNGDGPRLGWDTELAWRLRKVGWEAGFHPEVYIYRRYPHPPRLRWLRDHWNRTEDLPRLMASVPELRHQWLTGRFFASRYTMYFDLLAVGLFAALLQRRWKWLLLGVPWLLSLGPKLDFWPPRRWRYSTRLLARMGVRHLVWLGGLLRGSAASRRVVL